MKIKSIDAHSIADELGLRPGCDVRKINGQRIRDILDFRYYVADENVELEVEQDGEITIYEIEKEADDTLGITFEPLKIRMCGNDCPFCFVDQNPAGMRKSLYFRDEDYRLSFLAGHYVTMTNLSRRDLEKIVTQRLTPLFISVHAIDPEVRKFVLGIRHDDRLLEKIKFLTSNGIELHTQIVVCPGVNDGAVMDRTIQKMAEHFPQIRSVALVPLGLTKHRDGLAQLTPVTPEYARGLLATADRYAAGYKRKFGKYFVYPSDEFYIMAGLPLPAKSRYDTFDQLENGVGMVRSLLDGFEKCKKRMPAAIARPAKITLVTGTLMAEIMAREIVATLNAVRNLQVELVVVENVFYGHSIRISGLLVGSDIYNALAGRATGDRIYLPKNCVNDEQLFLDDWSIPRLAEKLATPIRAIPNDFNEIFRDLQSVEMAA